MLKTAHIAAITKKIFLTFLLHFLYYDLSMLSKSLSEAFDITILSVTVNMSSLSFSVITGDGFYYYSILMLAPDDVTGFLSGIGFIFSGSLFWKTERSSGYADFLTLTVAAKLFSDICGTVSGDVIGLAVSNDIERRDVICLGFCYLIFLLYFKYQCRNN